MPFTPLALPPGVWRNGTEYQARGRYFDSNLVRWYDGQLRPWGGWSLFSTTTLSAPPVRGMAQWIDASGLFWMLMGTPTKVYVTDFAGEISDITPSGLTPGRADATNAAGYGSGAYGSGNYGVSSGSSSVVQPATVWTMDTLEQNPVACNADDGKIYSWNLVTADPMTQCSGSPTNCRGVFVTQDGFVVALGAGGDPRLIQWADQSSLTDWTPTPDNQARDYELQSAGQVMCGVATIAGSILFCTTDIHLMTYIGLPDVYGVNQIGTGCGIIAQGAHALGDNFVAWMGVNSFWQYNGTVSAIESDVADYVFSNLNIVQASKVWALHNATFGEITWFYPSGTNTEISDYVTWNYRESTWAIGKLVRTAGIQANIITNPVMVDAGGSIWSHEVNFTYTGAAAPYAETGPFELDESYTGDTLTGYHPGSRTFDIMNLIPDSKTLGDVEATFFTRFYPLDDEVTWGPYAIAELTNVRIAGREARVRFTGISASDWRVGVPRLEFRQGGDR